MFTLKKSLWLVLLMSIAASSCKKDTTEPDDNELITTVRLKFTEAGTTLATTFEYKDPDGDGGAAPTKFDKVSLKKGATYSFAIEVLNESTSPASDITQEIASKADEHLFNYASTPVGLVTFTITDKDSKNLPVGLKANVVAATTAGTGKLKVQLRHQPGTKNGTLTPGSDDINLDFDLEVK
ncbi:MAG: hypothetical protein U0Y10_26540 [Spirosomataceae bacterium]